MLSTKEVIEDLKFMCGQTNAHWICFDDIHTENMKADTALYLKELKRLGYLTEDLLVMGFMHPAYAGGLEIKHQEEALGSGYTLKGKGKCNKRLVVLSGFSRQIDNHTVYHEGAHLYQFEYNMFNICNRGEYETYLSETHANTFAAMVLLLKSENMLEYKKQQLSLFANSVSIVNDECKNKQFIYYLSLPIELELMKRIKKEGRRNVERKFSKKGHLDFKKIAFYTARLVRQFGFSEEEFSEIQKGKYVLRYELLKRKAKANRILGKTYRYYEKQRRKSQEHRHDAIEAKRIKIKKEKLEPLPSIGKEAEIINAACALDNFQVQLFQRYKIYDSLLNITEGKVCVVPDELKRNKETLEYITATYEKMQKIYHRWEKEASFQNLVSELLSSETRESVWTLKEEKRKNLKRRNFEFGFFRER